jgi:hypothetical protein
MKVIPQRYEQAGLVYNHRRFVKQKGDSDLNRGLKSL